MSRPGWVGCGISPVLSIGYSYTCVWGLPGPLAAARRRIGTTGAARWSCLAGHGSPEGKAPRAAPDSCNTQHTTCIMKRGRARRTVVEGTHRSESSDKWSRSSLTRWRRPASPRLHRERNPHRASFWPWEAGWCRVGGGSRRYDGGAWRFGLLCVPWHRSLAVLPTPGRPERWDGIAARAPPRVATSKTPGESHSACG